MKFTPHKESLTSKLFRSGLMALILLCCLNINAEEDPDKPILVPQTGHAFPIVSQDVERRYKYLFTADARGNIKKWDIASGKLMRNMHTSQPSIDKIKMLKGVSNSAGRNQMLIYSNQTNSIEIIDYAADTLITKFAWNDNLLACRYMYTKDFAGLTKALIFCSSTHRYYLSPEDYSVLKKIEHGVQPDRDLVFLDEFGIQSFIVKGNAIYYHETKTSGNRFKRSISLPLRGKDTIRNVRYRFEARSKVKDIVLVATDSSFFVINPVVGKYFEVSRKMNTSENLAAMTKSIYGNGRTEGNNYYLQHNTLSFLGKSNLVVLGEGLYDLGKGQFTSLSVPNLTHAYPVYRNYSDLRFLVGNDRENVKRYDVKDGQTLNFGTDSTVFDRLFFNNKTRNLYACTSNEVYKNSSVVNMDLNYAKTNSIKLATWHKISISDATRTYVFQYDTFEQKELGQLYLLSTGKRISSIPAKPGYRISKALFWQSWQYLFYIETKADGSESKLRMWNTVDGTYRDIGSPGAYNFALNEGHKEIAVAYPDKVVKYSLVDYKKSNKLKINGIKDMGMTTTGFVYFIKEEYADNSKLANDKDLPDLVKVSHRGVKVNDTEKSVGLQNSFNLMKEMFEDVNRTSGIQVISAAAGNSYALESDEWKNGIFTYCLLEAMRENEVRKAQSVPTCDLNKDDFCSVSELRYYVGQRVEELTNGLQKPTSRQGNLEFDFRIW